MRWVFWILGLFALAVAVALALRFNDGYALFVWPPYRVELSLNLLALTLGAAFAAGYLLVRFIFGALALPAKVREYRERRRRESSHGILRDAVRAFDRSNGSRRVASPAEHTALVDDPTWVEAS